MGRASYIRFDTQVSPVIKAAERLGSVVLAPAFPAQDFFHR
jgi:hypothetical protein